MEQIDLDALVGADVAGALVNLAKRNGRPVQEEIRRILTREVSPERLAIHDRLAERRARMADLDSAEAPPSSG